MPRHLLHGLCVEADTTLSALAAPADRAVDVRLCPWQVDRASFDAYLGELLAAPPLIDRRYTTSDDALTTRAISAEHGRLWLSVFFDRVLFALDRDSGELRRYVRREQEVPFGEVLQAGSYWAVLLALRGRVAHHASAVDVPDLGGSVILAARTGHGKSSTAAALMLAGAALRSDDVVTFAERSPDVPRCESGSLTLRMRQPIACALPSTLDAVPGLSGDQRHLYASSAPIADTAPVIAVLFPELQTGDTTMTLEPLATLEAFQRLAQEPRVGGIQERSQIAARVDQLGALCRAVPLRRVRLSLENRDLARQGEELRKLLRDDLQRSPS